MILHGGYWKNRYGLDDEYGNAGTISLAPFFVKCGFAAVEVEYRRRDHEGGGWPGTNEDILDAMRLLAELPRAAGGGACGEPAAAALAALGARCLATARRVRPDRLILAGHSAGGCLALWAAHRPPECVKVAAVLAFAPVADLVRGHELRISDEGDAVELYMRCTPDTDEGRRNYEMASPAALLPLTTPTLVVYGAADKDVPPELVTSYCRAAAAQTPELLREVMVPAADHFDVVNTGSVAWREHILAEVAGLVESAIGADAGAAVRQAAP